MKRLLVFGTAIAMTVLLALPVAADPPSMGVDVYSQDFWEDNPCTEEVDTIHFKGTTTLREIVQGDRRITAVSHEITGPSPWSGRGTDTGVELAQGENVLAQIMVTNSETHQKFKFFHQVHFNANTGEWNPGAHFGSTCVRP